MQSTVDNIKKSIEYKTEKTINDIALKDRPVKFKYVALLNMVATVIESGESRGKIIRALKKVLEVLEGE